MDNTTELMEQEINGILLSFHHVTEHLDDIEQVNKAIAKFIGKALKEWHEQVLLDARAVVEALAKSLDEIAKD